MTGTARTPTGSGSGSRASRPRSPSAAGTGPGGGRRDAPAGVGPLVGVLVAGAAGRYPCGAGAFHEPDAARPLALEAGVDGVGAASTALDDAAYPARPGLDAVGAAGRPRLTRRYSPDPADGGVAARPAAAAVADPDAGHRERGDRGGRVRDAGRLAASAPARDDPDGDRDC